MINLIRSISVILYSLFAIGYLSGCITLDSSTKQDEVAQIRSSVSEELIKVKQDVSSLKGQLEEIQYKIDKIEKTERQQSNELNATLKEWRKETQSDIEKRVSGTEAKIEALEKKHSQDKKELQERSNIIVEEVTKENKELRREIESVRKSESPQIDAGYYVVSQGDNLSKIAQMYGISIKTLMEANSITDPNSIHTGQKLNIPKRE